MASASMRDSLEEPVVDSTDITLRGMVVQLEPHVINGSDGVEKTVFIMRIEIRSSETDKLFQHLNSRGNGNFSQSDKYYKTEAGIYSRRRCSYDSYKPTTSSEFLTLGTQDLLTQCLRCKGVAENLKWVTEVAFENAFDGEASHPTIDEVASRSNNLRVPEHIFQQLEREPNLSTSREAVVSIKEVFDWYMPLVHNLPIDRYLRILKNHFMSERLHLRRLKNILNGIENQSQNATNEEDPRVQIGQVGTKLDWDTVLLPDTEMSITDIPMTSQESNNSKSIPSVNSTESSKPCSFWGGTVNLDILSTTDKLAIVETCATTVKPLLATTPEIRAPLYYDRIFTERIFLFFISMVANPSKTGTPLFRITTTKFSTNHS